MIRSTYRNLMILMLFMCFGVSFYLFRKTQDVQLEIGSRQNDIIRLRQELENAQSLNVALNELDNLTITEQTATQLDILRHLGLEQSKLNFTLESREEQVVGDTRLYVHNVRITGIMPYETALNLSDKLQSTKKIVLDSIELIAQSADPNNYISFSLTGKIYGLEKNIEAMASQLPPENTEPQPVDIQPTPDASPSIEPIPAQPETMVPDVSVSIPVLGAANPAEEVSVPATSNPNQEVTQ